jgi:hypothetical protein
MFKKKQNNNVVIEKEKKHNLKENVFVSKLIFWIYFFLG